MSELNATDANFIHFESPQTPMHIASVQMIQLPHGMRESDYLKVLREHIAQRAVEVPYMMRRLNRTGMRWEPVETIDIDRHVRMAPEGFESSGRRFDRAVAAAHSMPLAGDGPLWDILLIPGPGDGRAALYNRVHHACVDGLGGQIAIARLSDSGIEPREAQLPCVRKTNSTALGDWLNLGTRLVVEQLDALQSWPRQIEAVLRSAQLAAHPLAGETQLFAPAPRTMLNRTIGSARTYASGILPLTVMQALARAHSCSLNDVFLAVCGGALRRYLERNGALPQATLQAGVPVGLRKGTDVKADNQLSMMRIPMRTDIDNGVERLAAIARASRYAKQLLTHTLPLQSNPSALLTAPLQMLLAQQVRLSSSVGAVQPSMVNLIISNVPGPRSRRYFAGAEMLSHYPVSIPAHGLGVNITVQSYDGAMYFGITGCASTLPDAYNLRDDMLGEWRRLACEVRAPAPAAPVRGVERLVA